MLFIHTTQPMPCNSSKFLTFNPGLPRALQKDLRMQYIHKSPGTSFCEWKGPATYWTVAVGDKSAPKVGWSYENPTPGFVPIKSHIAFYCALHRGWGDGSAPTGGFLWRLDNQRCCGAI